MKKIMIIGMVAALCSGTAACTQTEQRTAGYGASGAALGALAGGALTGTGHGALAGAAIGATGGALVGNATNDRVHRREVRYSKHHYSTHKYCNYQDKYGEWYKAPC